jgi:2-phosphosulfolactate phosphatase
VPGPNNDFASTHDGLTMEICIESLLSGAQRANGAVVIIDVFRAFTTAATALSRGASKIIMVSSVEEALALREAGVGHICVGEVDGRAPDSFDFGNSPFELSQAEVTGKTVIHRTSAGTQGIVAAKKAEQLYAGSLVTAAATARAIRSIAPSRVTLVAMGDSGILRTDEDEVCALHLRNLLEGRSGDSEAVRAFILAGARISEFRDPANSHLHPGDLEIALDVSRYDFAVRVLQEEGRSVARIECVP